MHIDLRALHRIEQLVLAEYAFHFVRYFVIAGGAYLAFYIGFRRQMIGRKIQSGFPNQTYWTLREKTISIWHSAGRLIFVLERRWRGWKVKLRSTRFCGGCLS